MQSMAGLAVMLALSGVFMAQASETPVYFSRDIRPILSDNCYACHGPDAKARKAGLRLDLKDGLYEKTEKREPAVVPGNLEKSELWRRINATDPDEVMPPPESHKTLTAEQKEFIKRWIQAGAIWQGHWAFIKPEWPVMPEAAKLGGKSSDFKIRNPIDTLVLSKLASKGLAPAAEADRPTLIRRVALDLTGLPPTPEEVEAFVKDPALDAYERLVKKLLMSPRWGEHRGRYWLDAARYADTHGLHFDNYREMWPYRDWVVRAFNENLPFDQFTLKQLAGDLLQDPDRDDLTATGFHRCNMTTNEGGTIDEENEAIYANDRVTTTSWVWLGLTANCAACHDHKFDPITTKDFYSMAAFFRNTEQPAKDGNSKDSNPSIVVPQSAAEAARWDVLPGEISAAKKGMEERRAQAKPDYEMWLSKAAPADLDRDLPLTNLLVHLPLLTQVSGEAPTAAGCVKSVKLAENLEWQDGELGQALVLKSGATLDLGDQGNFSKTNAFSYGGWVRVSKAGDAAIIARMDPANGYRGWDLYLNNKRLAVHIVSQWQDDALKVATREEVIKEKVWQHLFVTYDGSGKGKGVKIFVDGNEVPVKADPDKLKGDIQTPVGLKVGQRNTGHVFERGRVQDVRVYDRRLEPSEVMALAKVVRVQSILALAGDKRTKEQGETVFDYWITSRDKFYVETFQRHAALNQERDAIRGRNPVTHVQREKTNSMAMARILFRGQYDRPQDKVTAETIAVLHAMPKDAPKNRLGLGQWINAPENPLTARVTVNRFWSELFGMGLVKTAEDFGTAGDAPVNPELLDWLALEFQQSGWDVKKLFEVIVTSSTYRQSAEVTPEKLEKDPQNRLLSRGPRFRMDAEMIRDYALAASGLLSEKIGGAPVRPYQPEGLWEAVAMPESNTKSYKADTGESLYRRSLYTFLKRASPPATMDIFNAPSREVCTVRRERTNTPLQALVTMNDPQFVEAARALAELALTRAARPDDAPEAMAQRLLCRPLTAQERSIVLRTWTEMRRHYEEHPEAAEALLGVGQSKPSGKVPATQLAAMTLVANQLLNMDEVLNK